MSSTKYPLSHTHTYAWSHICNEKFNKSHGFEIRIGLADWAGLTENQSRCLSDCICYSDVKNPKLVDKNQSKLGNQLALLTQINHFIGMD